ncbi:MAG: glycoside hydrolase family 15 protein [Solirubrobacterales bacterium]|nr:glycoside hydrolase family 15 protein [Solirubrobacterales bacterium]
MANPSGPRAVEAPPRRVDGYLPIEAYAAIGDGRTLALVGVDGSIDWMCLPELDAPSAFGALLDPADGGSFSLAPAVPSEARRSYLPETNVLETEYVTDHGSVRVTDALTIDISQNAPWRELVRRVEGLSGTVPMQWRLRPRFDYGQVSSDPLPAAGALVYRHRRLQLAIKGWDSGKPSVERGTVTGRFEIGSGQQAMLVLVAGDGVALPSPERADVERRLQATVTLWRDWLGHTTYAGPWKPAVQRSLLAIRLLADGRTGAITAAGTTSLPEVLGGERNYDYRFGWVRDLSFTVDALLRVGMEELAHASVGWVLQAVGRTRPRIDPVYALTGDALRSQEKLPLPGYRRTGPVHRGNQAGSQLQLGGFGDLVETVSRYVESGHVLAPETGERIADSADLLSAIWRSCDAGLWELQDYAHYATSKIGCWSAFDRVLALADARQVPPRHVERWRSARDQVRRFIETELWSDERGSYVMKAGSDMLDCGVLLAARRGYTDPHGPRLRGTIRAIRGELQAEGPLFYRYSGMQEEENAFLACSFWMVEALALAGQVDEAAAMMDALVSLGGGLGLYSEEMECGSHAMRGNFPQALTHLALISAADIVARCSGDAGAPGRAMPRGTS